MELILIRHAEAENQLVSDGRPADPGLTPRGREQAAAVARWLARESLAAIVSSPSRRARDTAAPTAQTFGLKIEIDPRISEIDPQATQYRSIEEERARDLEEFRRRIASYQSDPRLADLSARVETSLSEWASHHAGARVAVFCHGGVINVWTRRVLGLPPGMLFEAQNGSIQRYLVSREAVRGLKSLNEIGHLGYFRGTVLLCDDGHKEGVTLWTMGKGPDSESSLRSCEECMPSIEQLKVRLSRSLKAGKVQGALAAIAALTDKEPNEAAWPKRAARLLRGTEDVDARLAALRRARELQVDQGLVLDAIASCKSILEIVPDDEDSLDCLDLLFLSQGTSKSPTRTRGADVEPSAIAKSVGRGSEDALDTLLLRDCVPGARSVQFGDAAPGHISEIPLDSSRSMSGDHESDVVDLRLDAWSSPSDLQSLRAAQHATLPHASAAEQSGESDRGKSLRAELANIPLFGDLDPASLHTLIRRVRVVRLDAGQILFRQGDPANSLYVVVEGAVVPVAEGERRRKLAVLERGAFFGEIGLMAKQPRNATIEALVDTKLLAIDRRVLWELIDSAPSVAQSILRFLRSRLLDRQIRTNLFFAAFAHAEREAVARQFRVLEVTDGTRIVEQGQAPEGLFVVLSGSLEIRDRDQNKILGELGLGDVFGGLSLIEGQVSPAEVVAAGKCWLVVLGESRFRKILDANPRLIRVLKRIASEGVAAASDSGVAPL